VQKISKYSSYRAVGIEMCLSNFTGDDSEECNLDPSGTLKLPFAF
jgi:hypothetical protein